MSDKRTPNESMSLAGLAPDARARVEKALKEALDRELVDTAVSAGGLAAAGNIFSRGWIFSRLTPTAEAELARVLPELSKMGSEEFVNFAARLSELKAAKTGPQR
jgi:hypothetical protein